MASQGLPYFDDPADLDGLFQGGRSIACVSLGEAVSTCSKPSKINKETFQQIREFRSKMAEYDRRWGRG